MADGKEKKAFYELKKRMAGDMEDDLYEDDNVFYRFLRARNLKVDLAEAMLREHLEWREKYDVKNAIKYEYPEVLKNYFPVNFVGYTREGYVIDYVPTGRIDAKGLIASFKNEDFAKHMIKFCEEDLARLKVHSKKIGKLVDKVVYIHDFRELTLAKVTDRKVIYHMILFSNMYLDNYPETMSAVYVINAPTFVGLIFSLLKSFLPNNVLQKIKIYTDDGWRKDLLEIVDAEVLPAFLGGKRTDPDGNPLCNTFINHAGLLVPEKYYRNKRSFAILPDVQKGTVSRAAIHEMYLEVEVPGSYLEWEFQIKSGDIKFGIVYQDSMGEKIEVVPLQRITTDEYTEAGAYKCKNVGTYIVVFDNSYSFLRSKDVFYKIQVTSPRDETGFLDDTKHI